MTASTVKSTLVTNANAQGTNAALMSPSQRAITRHVVDAVTVATTSVDEAGDIVLLAPVPSNARVLSLRVFNGAMDTNGTPTLTHRVGLFYAGNNGAANTVGNELTTANAIVSTAQSTLRSANTSGVELYYINRSLVADKDKRLWELGGLTADCGGMLAFGFKVVGVAATAASADLLVHVQYVLE